MTSDRGIGMSTNQLIEPHYYSMAHAPQWLKDEQEKQILEFLNSISNSPHLEDYEEPLMEIINFGKDPEHQYNPSIMKQYADITENYDIFRGHNVMDVAPEFKRIKDEL